MPIFIKSRKDVRKINELDSCPIKIPLKKVNQKKRNDITFHLTGLAESCWLQFAAMWSTPL